MRKRKIYPDFAASTGYGTGAGLCGWNCRHSFGPYVEGAPRVWTDEKLAELNEPKFEYNGEKLTEYEATQQQRYFERQIRRWKREYVAMEAAGQDASEAVAKSKEWRARKKDFLENRTDLRLAEREREKQWGVQYGEDAITADREYILSDAYAQKFKGLTGRPDVDQIICDHARNAVLDNSGTLYESMYLLDAETGETQGSIDKPSDQIERGVAYTPEFRKALIDAKKVIGRLLQFIIILREHHPVWKTTTKRWITGTCSALHAGRMVKYTGIILLQRSYQTQNYFTMKLSGRLTKGLILTEHTERC